MTDMEGGLLTLSDEVTTLEAAAADLRTELENLKEKCEDMEGRMRRKCLNCGCCGGSRLKLNSVSCKTFERHIKFGKGFICFITTRTVPRCCDRQWEEDLGEQIPVDIWHKRIHSSSICQHLAVIQFKVVNRLHWCKVGLSKLKPDVNPICNRCRQALAGLLHMYWTCQALHNFWKSVFDTLSPVLEQPLDHSPFIALFGVAPPDKH